MCSFIFHYSPVTRHALRKFSFSFSLCHIQSHTRTDYLSFLSLFFSLYFSISLSFSLCSHRPYPADVIRFQRIKGRIGRKAKPLAPLHNIVSFGQRNLLLLHYLRYIAVTNKPVNALISSTCALRHVRIPPILQPNSALLNVIDTVAPTRADKVGKKCPLAPLNTNLFSFPSPLLLLPTILNAETHSRISRLGRESKLRNKNVGR